MTATGVRRPVVVADVLSTIRPARVTEAKREVPVIRRGDSSGLPGVPHVARVDLIPGPREPVVLELEATDCFLFLCRATAEARSRMVEHLLTRCSGAT